MPWTCVAFVGVGLLRWEEPTGCAGLHQESETLTRRAHALPPRHRAFTLASDDGRYTGLISTSSETTGVNMSRWIRALLLPLLVAACDPDTPIADTDRDSQTETEAPASTEVLIPAGTFSMGPTGEERQITLTRPFWMQHTEVSQADWAALVPRNPSTTQDPAHPVERVSWYDAMFYANELSAQEGLTECFDLSECSGTPGVVGVGAAYLCPDRRTLNLDCDGYRLPTEAEWEYAAGLGAGSDEPACDGDADPDIIYCKGSDYTTQPVTAGEADGLGMYGMRSNVGEWVWDWFDAYKGATTDPVGASSGTTRVRRGGGWRFNANKCRITHRTSDYPACQNDSLGLRLVRTAE
ncbi:MAG: sulfatase activating formylglycine-generating enzyme [Kiritimatiellia bacterium]